MSQNENLDRRDLLSWTPGLYVNGCGMIEAELAAAIVAYAESLGYVPEPWDEEKRGHKAWYDDRADAITWLNRAAGRPQDFHFSADFHGLWVSMRKHCMNAQATQPQVGPMQITWPLLTYPLVSANPKYPNPRPCTVEWVTAALREKFKIGSIVAAALKHQTLGNPHALMIGEIVRSKAQGCYCRRMLKAANGAYFNLDYWDIIAYPQHIENIVKPGVTLTIRGEITADRLDMLMQNPAALLE